MKTTCKPYSIAEIEIIEKNYYSKGAIGVSRMLTGRTSGAIKKWASKNGLKVSKEYRSSVATRINLIHKRNMSGETRKRIGDGHRKYDTFTCEECGKKISHYSKLCRDCYNLTAAGAGNNNWRGGVSSITKIVHTALKSMWRAPIMERDNYTCQMCWTTGNMEVHHLRRYVKIRDDIIKANPYLSVETISGKFELAKLIIQDHKLTDGVTLCDECHKSVHGKKQDELLEPPNANGEGDQQASRGNIIKLVPRKLQRLTGEDIIKTNNPDTSVLRTVSQQL